jgi:hypothetical protein
MRINVNKIIGYLHQPKISLIVNESNLKNILLID